MAEHSLFFDGTFKQEHIDEIKRIMNQANLGTRDLAYLLSCSDSSIRLWLNGRNPRCQPHFIPAFQILFSGELEELLTLAGQRDRIPKRRRPRQKST